MFQSSVPPPVQATPVFMTLGMTGMDYTADGGQGQMDNLDLIRMLNSAGAPKSIRRRKGEAENGGVNFKGNNNNREQAAHGTTVRMSLVLLLLFVVATVVVAATVVLVVATVVAAAVVYYCCYC